MVSGDEIFPPDCRRITRNLPSRVGLRTVNRMFVSDKTSAFNRVQRPSNKQTTTGSISINQKPQNSTHLNKRSNLGGFAYSIHYTSSGWTPLGRGSDGRFRTAPLSRQTKPKPVWHSPRSLIVLVPITSTVRTCPLEFLPYFDAAHRGASPRGNSRARTEAVLDEFAVW